MNKIEFQEFYDNCIKVIASRFLEKHREFTFIDNSASIYEEYMNQKVMLHIVYVKNDLLLDRHKVCACMAAAIIKTRPLVCPFQKDDDFSLTDMQCVNEQLAFLASWELLKGFVVARNEESGNNFKLPNTFHNISFVDTVTRSLFMANQLNGISTPLIANIFFLLEKYCMDIKESP